MNRYPLPVIQSAYASFDEHVAGTVALALAQDSKASPCKRGCSACCSEPLIVTQYCMPPIVEAIRAMPAEQQAAIKLRIKEWHRVVRHKGIHPDATDPNLDFAAWHRGTKPVCPLLDVPTGDCMIYEARPMGCRAHVSVEPDASACDRADVSRGVDVLLFTEPLARVAAHIMSHSVRGEPRDIPLLMLLLPSMLRRAWVLIKEPALDYFDWLEDIEHRWRKGEPI